MLSSIVRGLAAAVVMLLALHGSSSALAEESSEEAPGTSQRAGSTGRCENASLSAVRLGSKAASQAALCLINKRRDRHGLRALRPNRSLQQAAMRHSAKMVASGCFDHHCSGEPDVVGRLTSAGYLPCGCSWRIGENLAWGKKRRSTPAAIVKAWMKSPAHRANILSKGFEDVDIGVLAGKPGNPHVRAATYTADFGGRH